MKKLNRTVRKHVMNLADLMYYANSREDGQWASQSSGPYGYAYKTIKSIITEELGAEIASETMERINYGGDRSFGHDVLNAIEEAQHSLAQAMVLAGIE